MEKIVIKVKPNQEQLQKLQELLQQKDSRKIPKGETMSPLLRYLTNQFGSEIGEALFIQHSDEQEK